MKPAIFIMLLSALCIAAAEGCKPKSNCDNITGGGKGGNATIIAQVDHYGALLDTSIVYVKYATLYAPADNVYDDSVRVGTDFHAVFANLTVGNYYFFAKGIHDPFDPPTVEGGRAWTICSNAVDTVTITTDQQNFVYPFL